MAQVKVFGIKEALNPIKQQLSDVIHACVVEALQFPQDKRAHRFFPMEKEDMLYPTGRTDAYTIIEITMIEGRSVEARKRLFVCCLTTSMLNWESVYKTSKSASSRVRRTIGAFVGCTAMRSN